jgi:hypothetical protein
MEPLSSRLSNEISTSGSSPKESSNDSISSLARPIFNTYHLSSAQASPLIRREYVQNQGFIDDFSKLLDAFRSGHLNPSEAEIATLEIVAKVLSYDQLIHNEEIRLPARTLSNPNHLEFKPFIIKIIELVDGNRAYLFEPKIKDGEKPDCSPILSFRGTSVKAAPGSLKADLGYAAVSPGILSTEMFPSPEVGSSVVNDSTSAATISDVLRETSLKYGKVILTGHSLGGKLASSFSMASGNYTKVKKLISFNAPGVSKAEQVSYQYLGASAFPALSVTTKGDIIGNSISSRRFFNRQITIDPKDIKLSPISAHQVCVAAGNNLAINIKESRSLKTRKILRVARIISYILVIGVLAWVTSRLALLAIAKIVENKHANHVKDREFNAAFGIVLDKRKNPPSNSQPLLEDK